MKKNKGQIALVWVFLIFLFGLMVFFLKERVAFGGCYECSQGIDCLPGTADCGAGKTCSRFCGGTAIGWYTCCWPDDTPTQRANPPTSAPPPRGVTPRATTPPGGTTSDCRIIGCPSGNGIQCCPDGVCRFGGCSATACSDGDSNDDARCIDGEVPGSRGVLPEAQITYDAAVNKIKIYFDPGNTCWRTGKNCQDGTWQSFNACWGKLEIYRNGNLIKTLQQPYQGHPDGYLINFHDDANPFERHVYSFKAVWDETYPACSGSSCTHPPASCIRSYTYEPPPCQPKDLICSTADCGSKNIALRWNVENPFGNVVLKRHDGSDWTDVVSLPAAGSMSYTDSPNWGSYNYMAVCGEYGSNQVGCSTIQCPTPTPTLPPPSNLQAFCSAPGGPISLQWNNAGGNTQGYMIAKKPTTTPSWNYSYAYVPHPTNTFQDNFSVTPGLTYSYNVQSCYNQNLCPGNYYANQVNITCPTPQPATISSLSCYVTPTPQTCDCTNDDTPEWKWQVSGSYVIDYNLYRSWESQNPRSCVGSPNVCSFPNRHFFPGGLVGKTGTFTFEVSALNTQEGPKKSSVVKIDKLAPYDPEFISVSCLNGKISASWVTGIDRGCGGLHQFPYRAQYSLSSDFSTVQNDMSGDNNWKDLWGSNTSRTSAKVFPTGTTVYVRVKYRDVFDHQTEWVSQSAVCLPNSCEDPSLTPLPPQKSNTQVNFSFTAPVGASSCTLNVDGQQQAQVTPNPTNRSCNLSWTPTSSKNYWFRTFTTTNNQPTDCQSGNFCIDSLPPSIPQNRQLNCFYDGSLRGYRITYSWDPLSQDNGCAGLDTYPYLAQYSLSSSFSNYQNDMSGDNQWKDLWGQNSQRTTGKAFSSGQNVCFRVKSRDSLENESNWSSVSCITVNNQRCEGGPTDSPPQTTVTPNPTPTGQNPPATGTPSPGVSPGSGTPTPTPTPTLQPPINLKTQCSADATSFTVTWQSPTGADHQNFWLQVGTSPERHPDNPNDSFSDGSLVSANKFNDWVGKVYSKTITAVTAGTDYYVIIKASSSSGQQSRWTPDHSLPPVKVTCIYSNNSSVYGYTFVDEGSNDPQTRGIPGCAANDRSVCIYDGKFQERAICGARIIMAGNSAGTNPPNNFDVNSSSYNSFSIFCYSAYNQKWSRWNEDDPVKNYQCQLNPDKTLLIRTCTETGNPNCNWVNCGSVADFFQGNIFIGGVKNLQTCKSASYLQEVQIRPKYVFYSCPKAARAGGITDYHLPPEENNEYKVWLVSHTSGNFPGFFNTYYDTQGSPKTLYLVPDEDYILSKLGSYSTIAEETNILVKIMNIILKMLKKITLAQSSSYQYGQFYPQSSSQTYSPSTNSGPVYFALSLEAIPTPTPTPTPSPTPIFSPENWQKVKDAGFQKYNSSPLIINIPQNPSPFDNEDDSSPYFITTSNNSDPGIVGAQTIQFLSNHPQGKLSASNWQVSLYTIAQLDVDGWRQYLQSRKEYIQINSINQIEEGKIHLVSNNLSINPEVIAGKTFVLVVEGKVEINSASQTFNPTGEKSFAIIAKEIEFNSQIKEARGIFVADVIKSGDNSNYGLKIKGNLVAFDHYINQRSWVNSSKPTLFVILDPKAYVDLLPILSIRKYDWKQIE